MADWDLYVTNSTIQRGHLQEVFRTSEDQLGKIVYYIKKLEDYTIRDDGLQRNLIRSGEGRSGHVEETNMWNSRAANLSAYFHEWNRTPRFKPGDIYGENTGSGKKVPGANRIYAAIKENVCTFVTTSNPDEVVPRMVKGQLEGVHLNDPRFPDFDRTQEEKRLFEKYYGKIEPEKHVLLIPGRESSLLNLNESLCLANSGNLFELSSYVVKTNKLLTFYKWNKGECSKESLGEEFMRLMEESEKGFRDGFPVILDQRDKIERCYEEIIPKSLVLVIGVGPGSSKIADALEMRGGQSLYNKPGRKEIIHINSENKPVVDIKLKSLSEEEIRNNVGLITISNSLKTDANRLTREYMRHGIEPFLWTSNMKHKLAQQNLENSIYVPNEPVYRLKEGREVAFFHPLAFAALDNVNSIWVKRSKRKISETHKED